MKFLKFLVILFFLMLMSCQQNKIPIQPEILTAEYEILTNDDFERGYQIFLEFKMNKDLDIEAIVLKNKYFLFKEKGIESECCYLIDQYFPVQSKLIQNFVPPKPDTRPDGIIFEIEGKAYFYEIEFRLK